MVRWLGSMIVLVMVVSLVAGTIGGCGGGAGGAVDPFVSCDQTVQKTATATQALLNDPTNVGLGCQVLDYSLQAVDNGCVTEEQAQAGNFDSLAAFRQSIVAEQQQVGC